MLRELAAVVLLIASCLLRCDGARAQGAPPHDAAAEALPGRMRVEFAGGPALEVATAGERASQRGLLAVPSLGVGVARWFEYVVEGHAAHYFTPAAGTVVGVVPVGFRIHTGGRTQVHLSAGAGLAWTDLTGLHGLDRATNYLTQIGGGIRRVRADASAVSVEARFFHLSNLSSAPPNLGIEVFAVLVGYRLPK